MIHIFGCGALGSQIALMLASPDRRFTLWDDDVVEVSNISTSAFWHIHVGSRKVNALADMLYHKDKSIAMTHARTLNETPAISPARLAVDTFDNSASRILTMRLDVPTLHVGVSAERTGSIVWNEHYSLSPDAMPRGENPVCTNQLGRPILRFTATVAVGIIEHFLATGKKRDAIVTEDMNMFS